jgi:hypothetical protein
VEETITEHPMRTIWRDFPDVVIHAPESFVKKHPFYGAAKAGDSVAAYILACDAVSPQTIDKILQLTAGKRPLLASAHAIEQAGVNAIPETLAEELGKRTEFQVESSIVQINVVGHTGANGFARLARPAMFNGNISQGADYLLVDDFIGQGGTLANMKGYIENRGGRVIGATVLTGKSYSARLMPADELLAALREKHGQEFES